MSDEKQELDPIKRLSKDLRKAAASLTVNQVRYLVDLYYQIQDFRIQSASQVRQMDDVDEPTNVIEWIFASQHTIEYNIKQSLEIYTDSEPTGMGVWAKSITGIGPVISAGLLAHINMEPWKCKHRETRPKHKGCTPEKPCSKGDCGRIKTATVGQIWRFAGLDPTSKWEKKTVRPWNAKLKVLCWKMGESFIKFQNHPKDVYGKLFAERLALETDNNYAGLYQGQAANILATKNFRDSTDAYIWYSGCFTFERVQQAKAELAPLFTELAQELSVIDASSESSKQKSKQKLQVKAKFEYRRKAILNKHRGEEGSGIPMLPPAHLQSRARRWAVKIFLYHWFAEAYRRKWNAEPPQPYVIAHLGHAHMIEAPIQASETD
jgi:hypothetical protein